MKHKVARYKTKPERAEENARLMVSVFAELKPRAPNGVRYLALKFGDGSFVRFAETEDRASSITELRRSECSRVASKTVASSHRRWSKGQWSAPMLGES
jgi:hypothetical protein